MMLTTRKREAPIEVWKYKKTGRWTWECWGPCSTDEPNLGYHDTHAEALAAALAHCAKAGAR